MYGRGPIGWHDFTILYIAFEKNFNAYFSRE